MPDYELGIRVDADDFDTLNQTVDQSSQSFSNFGGILTGIAIGGGVALLTGAVVKAGSALLELGGEMEDAKNTIIAGTGASGDALDAMLSSVSNLRTGIGGLGRESEEIGAVIAEMNTRTGATGESLEFMSDQILQFTRITEDDAVDAVRTVTRVMGDWNVENEDSGELMDQLFVAGQTWGIGLGSLGQKLVQFGSPLRQMDFTLEESIALLGKWEREGVNTELVLGSLRIAAGNFAEENIGLREGLDQTIEAIQDATTESEALTIAQGVFGARAAADMAAAIREGRLDIEEATRALEGSTGAIEKTSEATLTLRERAEIEWTKITESVTPLGTAILDIAEEHMPALTDFIDTTVVPTIENWIRTAVDGLTNPTGFIAAVQAAGEANTWEPLIGYLEESNQQLANFLNLVNQVVTAWGTVADVYGRIVNLGQSLREAFPELFVFSELLPPAQDVLDDLYGEQPQPEQRTLFTNPRTGTTRTVTGIAPSDPRAQAVFDFLANLSPGPFPDQALDQLIRDETGLDPVAAALARMGGGAGGGLTINVSIGGNPAPAILRSNVEQGVMAAVKAAGLAI